MRTIRALLFAAVAIFVLVLPPGILPAYAADLGGPAPGEGPIPYRAPQVESTDYLWHGFYVGGHIGGGWQNGKDNATAAEVTKGAPFPLAISPPAADAPATGYFAGGQLGYNFRAGIAVLGLEADFAWAAVDNKWNNTWGAIAPTVPASFSLQDAGENKLQWLSTERVRVGMLASPLLMIYGTGGLAIGDVSSSYSTTASATGFPCVSCGGSTVSGVKYGYAAGAGLEYAINNHWSVKGEWLYYDLGKVTSSYTTAGAPGVPSYVVNWSTRADGNEARLGFNYKIWP